MLPMIRHRSTGRAGRLLLLLLALSLWPMASFGAMPCCPKGAPEATTDAVAASTHAGHAMHGGAHDAVDTALAASAGSDCHEADAAGHAHTGCDAECVARCATPSMFITLGVWPAPVHAQLHGATWHAAVPPVLQATRLLRPPIHA
ncbi:hypothetical protein [Alkalisalibacterium limincola]|uniref:hypothetical protein n=1 Tax=Alkalisalibacterium limincola TaxID=2699169 RepID=UPI00164F2E72|nr:hypothetical protein [Alkalisalibacterium limincola]